MSDTCSYEQKQQTNSTEKIDPIHEWQSISLVYHWNHLVQMNSIGCIEYVIKYAHSMDTAIKRQCCHTLVTFVTLCCVDIQSLQYLIDLNIIKTMTELLMDYKYLEKSEIIALIDAFLMLLEKSEFDSRIGRILKKKYPCLKLFCLIQQLQLKSVRKYNGC